MLLLKNFVKTLRNLCNFWLPEQSISHLNQLSGAELEFILPLLAGEGAILEIGAGTGCQSKILSEHGYSVEAVDLDSSTYKDDRVWPVKDYDGRTLPFEDDSFDVVFSSNVMEHIPHVAEFQSEIHRVLKADSMVIHLIPSFSWRIWTNLTQFIRYWGQSNVHGEHASNILSEIYYFSRRWWKKIYTQTDWELYKVGSNRLFYTGGSIMDKDLGMKVRKCLSYFLGGSCSVYLMKESPVSIPLKAKENPQSLCDDIYNSLKSNGMLFITVPNRKSYKVFLEGLEKEDMCYGYETHLQFFTKKHIRQVLQNSGFSKIVCLRDFGGSESRGIMSLIQFVFRLLGISTELRFVAFK